MTRLARVGDAGLRVVAVAILLGVEQLANHDRAVAAGVVDDLTSRRLDRLAHDVDAGLLVGVGRLHAVERGDGAQQRDAAARRDDFWASEGRVLSRSRPSKPSSMNRSCQRQTQVLDLPVRRMISFVPNPSAVNRTISARQTCFCAALRSLMRAWSPRRSAGETDMDFPVRIAQTRTRRQKRESQKGLNRQI